MKLYDRVYTRRELEAHVGRLEQIGGVRRWVCDEGEEKGVELIQVRTGAGLSYVVTPTKGMDISLTEFAGVPISWQSPNGDVHPSYYNAEGAWWLNTASGGLLMTCGFTQVGASGMEDGQTLGMHGRAHHLPAKQVAAEGTWMEDEYEIRVAGIIEETSIFGHHLRVHRQITSRIGENRIHIRDEIENAGFTPAPYMVLYHFNFGFPLLDSSTRLHFPSNRVLPRDDGVTTSGFDQWQVPVPGCDEQVYYHEDLSIAEGKASVLIENSQFPIAGGCIRRELTVQLTWSVGTLPKLVQWKMPGAGLYVLGIEPANCGVEGRPSARRSGELVTLSPGEAIENELELEVTVG